MNDRRDTYLFGWRGTCWRSTIAVGGSLWRRRVDSPLCQIGRCCAMQSSKHHDSQFEVHTLPDWQPMELLQNWRDVLMSLHTSNQTRRGVLDGLYAAEQVCVILTANIRTQLFHLRPIFNVDSNWLCEGKPYWIHSFIHSFSHTLFVSVTLQNCTFCSSSYTDSIKIWIWIVIAKLERVSRQWIGRAVRRSDIIEVVSWLLNEDTEAADVMALGRVPLGDGSWWDGFLIFSCLAARFVTFLLCYSSSDWSVIHDEIKFVWWHRYLLVQDFVQEASRLTRLRSSEGSSWSCCSRQGRPVNAKHDARCVMGKVK